MTPAAEKLTSKPRALERPQHGDLAQPAAPPALRILLVEDNAADAYIMHQACRAAAHPRFELTHVSRLAEATAFLEANSVDAVLLDLSLPDGHGLEVVSIVRSLVPFVAIVVTTGLDDENTAMRALREGAQDYLVKGQIDTGLLARSIRYAVERQRSEEALRQSNRRVQRILESITDCFFAVDRDWRFTYVNGQCEPFFGRPPAQLMGRTLWEEFPGGDDQEHDRGFRRAMDQGFAVHFQSAMGRPQRWFEVHAYPSNDGLSVYFRDVTEQKAADDRLAAEHGVTRLLAESASFEKASPRILETICRSLNWEYGLLWRVDPAAGVLRCIDVIRPPSSAAQVFERTSRDLPLERGRGLPGRAWEIKLPAWIEDVRSDANFPRAPVAQQAGILSGFAFPILVGDEPIAVMEFYSTNAAPADVPLLKMMAAICSEVGQFVQRKQAEAALRESEERAHRQFAELETLYQTAPVGLCFVDPELRFVKVNERLAELDGIPVPQHIGRTISEILPAAVSHLIESRIRDAISAGQPVSSEARVRPDGDSEESRDWLATCYPVMGRLNALLGVNVVVQDITERKRFEAALQRAHDELETRVRERTADLLTTNKQLLQEITERWRAETILSGEKRILELIAKRASLPEALDALCRFIEEQFPQSMCAIRLLDDSGDRLSHAAAPSLPTDFTEAVDQIEIGPAGGCCGTAAYRRERVVVEDIASDERMEPCRRLAIQHGLRSCWARPIVSARGNLLGTVAMYYQRPRNPGSDEIELIETAAHLASLAVERRIAEAQIQRQKEFAERLIHSSVDGICAFDRESRFTLWNPAMEAIFGIPRSQALGHAAIDLLPFLHDIGGESWFRDTLAGRTVAAKEQPFSLPEVDRAGLFDSHFAPLLDEYGAIVGGVAIIRDVTAHRQAEERARRQLDELAHVSRLVTMGEMASGLAHELNQPLCAIINYIGACIHNMQSPAGASTQELLDTMLEVQKQAERTGEVIRRLRDFVRRKEPRRGRVNINDAVREAVSFTRSDAAHHEVPIVLNLAPDLPPILADVIQIEQVILNLIRNALDAMSAVEPHKRLLTITSSAVDHCVQVAVTDSGHGLSAEALDRVFHPFYTTKANGMGMGLSISRSIIEAHDGRMEVKPNDDHGVTFFFRLPVSGSNSYAKC